MAEDTTAQDGLSRLWQHIVDFMRWLGQHELALLVILALIAGGIWGFVELADEVSEGDTAEWDEQLLLALRNPEDVTDPLGPLWVEELGRDITALGGTAVLTLLTVGTVGFLVLQRRWRMAAFVILAVVGAFVISFGLKDAFARPRPALVPHGLAVYTASFPSGHAALSTATYLTLAALLARLQTRRRVKGYLLFSGALIALLVGLSRVYLGVHWPTDVLGGWTIGAVWALLTWLLARQLQQQGQLEEELEPE